MGASIFDFVRTMLVLVLVIGLLLLMARFARKFQVSGGKFVAKPTGQVEVISRRSLGKHMSLLVIRVANRTFLVGQSAQQLTMLAEFGEGESNEVNVSGTMTSTEDLLTPGTASGTEANASGAWDAFVDRLREMTVRR
jgi:flagellar biogenesis protein FliO